MAGLSTNNCVYSEKLHFNQHCTNS